MKEGKRVLIVDDKEDIHWILSKVLKQGGYTSLSAVNGREALEQMEKSHPHAVILDIKMPEMNGLDLLKEVKKKGLNIPIIILTAYGEIGGAVEAMKLGAYDYLTKPFENQEVLLRVQKAVGEHKLREEINTLRSQLEERATLFELMGTSKPIKKVIEQIKCVAGTNFAVIICGETGVGKELVARAIHNISPRKDKAFVTVDCGSIPEHLLESELFGHEKGAFTGAYVTKQGQFELANEGTIFLDEINNIPLSMQNKLLRTLQEKCVRHVGGKQDNKVDIRVIAASNEKLEDLLTQHRLRRDLYHRLNEFTIEIPPLRERKDDLLLLSQHFLKTTNRELSKGVKGFTEQAVECLLSYSWPGNVRELKNVVRRAVLLSDHLVEPKHLLIPQDHPDLIQPFNSGKELTANGLSLKTIGKRAVEAAERTAILGALKQTGGNKSKAAKLLGIDYSTLHYKIKQYGISRFNGTGEVSLGRESP